jgi:hypothetical protein
MSKLEKGEAPITPIRERDSDTTTGVENAPFKKAPSPDGDASNPTIQQIFEKEKSWLLDNISLLSRSVSEMELTTITMRTSVFLRKWL